MDLKEEATGLVGWSADDETVEMSLLEGGLTGKTYGLRRSGPDPMAFVVRKLEPAEAGHFERTSRVLAAAGVAPTVVAASNSLLITEFVMDGHAATVAALGGVGTQGCAAVEAVGRAVGRLHALPPGATGMDARNDLAFWLAKAEAAGAGTEASLGPEVAARLRAEVAAAAVATPPAAAGTGEASALAAALVTAHGDLHPGNIILRPGSGAPPASADEGTPTATIPTAPPTAILVDLEHCGPRPAGEDLAYLFAVWGDLFYLAGFAPSPGAPCPYPSLAARRSFAGAYLQARKAAAAADAAAAPASGAPEPAPEEVDALLLEVEARFARGQRLRLMALWALIARGDSKNFMAGAVASFLPHLAMSTALLTEAEAETEAQAGAQRAQGNSAGAGGGVCGDILRRGLIVVAAERAAAAAAAETKAP